MQEDSLFSWVYANKSNFNRGKNEFKRPCSSPGSYFMIQAQGETRTYMADKFQAPLVIRHFCTTLIQQEGLAVAEALYVFLRELDTACEKTVSLNAFLTSPRTSVKHVKAYLTQVANEAALPDAVVGALAVLAEFRLLYALPRLLTELEKSLNKSKGLTDVSCYTSEELDSTSEKKILDILHQFGVSTPRLEKYIDPSLLKGYKLAWNNMIYDQSLKKDLDSLYETLTGAQR